MSRPYSVSTEEKAEAKVRTERIWLHNHRGARAADAFEAELRYALDLIAECPDMGDAPPDAPQRRHWFLTRSRFHVYYVVDHEREAIRVVRIRHEAQRPLKR